MILDLRELVVGVVSAISFAFDISDAELSDDLVSATVHVEGSAENHAGFLSLQGKAVLTGVARCGRCCKEFPCRLSFDLSYKLAEGLAGDDQEEFLLLEDGKLDLSEVVCDQLITEMPYRFLCTPDCKGLCPKCGCDLNVERCSCDTREIDPRWAALGSYFDEENENDHT